MFSIKLLSLLLLTGLSVAALTYNSESTSASNSKPSSSEARSENEQVLAEADVPRSEAYKYVRLWADYVFT